MRNTSPNALSGTDHVVYTWAHNPSAAIGAVVCLLLLVAWVRNQAQSKQEDTE